jgi:trehalose/maltose hydrolase-like predicted phosphorylase
MSLTSVYDGEWTVTISNSNASPSTLRDTKGAFLGNGKMGLISSFDKIGVQKSIISVDFDFNEQGMYKTNVNDGFDFTHIKFFDNKPVEETASTARLSTTSLNLFNGILTTNFVMTNSINSNIVDVSYDLYPVRHLPYCVMQTINITPRQTMSNLELFHEISCATNIMINDYNNNLIYSENADADKGLYILNGQGAFIDTGKKLSVASCYLTDDWSKFNLIGFNRYSRDPNRCYQKIVLTGLAANVQYKFHILTTQLTEYDFKTPNEEVKRIVLNVAHRSTVTTLRQNHVAAWNSMWRCNVSIDPKLGITTQEQEELQKLRLAVRYNLYNIWSSVREGIRTEVNPAALSVIDTYGTLFWDGDLWFMPLLVLFRPDIAKNVLEARYRVIDKAIQLASGYGYSGSKYPYVNETIGYVDGPYWDLNGPMHIFNTALVSVSAWNYYRVTQDKDWLQNKGYTMLKNNANFFADKVEVDTQGKWFLKNVYSFHDKISDNNALTNYLVKVALKYALEASYELNMVPNDKWGEVYFNLDMAYFNDDPLDIIKMDEDSVVGDTYKFLEMLVPLTPFYSKVYYLSMVSRDLSNVAENLDFYETKINPIYQDNPMNNMLRAWLAASMTNRPTVGIGYTEETYTLLMKILDENVVGLWGNFNMQNDGNKYNDLSLGALFVLLIVTTLGTLNISGSVSETRFYNESMGIKGTNICAMPKTFKNIRVTGVGGTDTFNVINNVFYP